MDLDVLDKPYKYENWTNLIRTLFPTEADLFAQKSPITDVDRERIESFSQFGTIRLNDRLDTQLALFEIRLRPNTTKLQINRVALHKIVSKLNESSLLTGALAVYVDEEKEKWRFSFIAKRQQYAASGALETWETEPKRYTYVLGTGEKTLTAQQRFKVLAGKSNKTLEDIADAFSVEKVSSEFFIQYKEHYQKFCEYLYGYSSARLIFKEEKPIRDYAKKLLGRLVFLYFLQKKRWLGGKIDSGTWNDGASDFIRLLFDHPATDKSRFYSNVLVPLYFRTLNTGEKERPGFAYRAPWGDVKVPFLNGGLFEEDPEGTEQFDFPEKLFADLLNLFDRYNFTIDESSPNDHEVGIDPEMLGHIFENLLEENRNKAGAFYTPKEIVHYLCQESLWQYLKSRLLPAQKPQDVVWSDSRQHDEAELETFVRHKERGRKDGFIYKNAHAIERALRQVRICDPAIGSGAFPMGLLHEIFHCHLELDLTKDYAQLKRDIIEHCIYGVDIDKGAVDIAQLRFWLALVVDENEPAPLPNLDYKIMQGDSLLERFEETDLSKLMAQEDTAADNGPLRGSDLFHIVSEPSIVFNTKEKTAIRKLLHDYYVAQSKASKKELLLKINKFVLDKVDYRIYKEKEKLLFEKSDIQTEINRQLEFKRDPVNLRTNLAKKETEIIALEQRRERLHKCLTVPEKPFFLWHLYFDEVLREHGGFDIIIGNPPYVQIQSLPDTYKNWLAAEGYDTFDKGSDLYALFYERGWQLLCPGGFLAFITSNKWMRAGYGETLRRFFIEKTNPLKLLDFGMAQNFANALTYTSIMLFQRSKPGSQIEICRAQSDYRYGTNVHDYFRTHRATIPNLSSESSWVAYTSDEYRIKEHVEKQGKTLEKKQGFWKIDINYGIKTGFNDAFIVPTKIKEEILENERAFTGGKTPSEVLFKKMLRGQDVRAWAPEWAGLWLINTHNGVKQEGIPRIDVAKDYPGVFQWLSKTAFSPVIQNRTDQGDHWSNLRNCAYLTDFSKPKIIYPNMTKYLPFTYDLGSGYFSNDKSFILTGEQLGWLVCFFNSKLFKFCFRQNFPELLGETYEVRKIFFDKIPVKKAGEHELLVFEVLAGYLSFLYEIIRSGEKKDIQHKQWAEFFEYLSNGLVYEMYFGDQLKSAGRDLFRYLPSHLPNPIDQKAGKEESLRQIGGLYSEISGRNHPVATNLYYMTSIPDIHIIENLKTEIKV